MKLIKRILDAVLNRPADDKPTTKKPVSAKAKKTAADKKLIRDAVNVQKRKNDAIEALGIRGERYKGESWWQQIKQIVRKYGGSPPQSGGRKDWFDR